MRAFALRALAAFLGTASLACAATDIPALRADTQLQLRPQPPGAVVVAAAGAAPLRENSWTLERLVEASLAQHPVISARRSDIAAAAAGVDAAEWQFYPSPSVRVDQIKGDRATVFALQQPVWTGGRLSADLGLAREREAGAHWSLAEAQFDLALRVTEAFGAWRAAGARRLALESGVERMLSLAATVARRGGAGVSAKADIDLVSARLAQLRSDFAAARSAQRSAEEYLVQLTGEDVGTLSFADEARPADGAPASVRDRMVEQALAANPLLRRVAAEADVARMQVEQARAARWPSVSLRAERQFGAYTGSQEEGSRIFFSVQYTPGAGLSSGAQIRAAEATLRGKVDARESARRDLAARVAAQVEEYDALNHRVGDAGRGLRAARDVLDSYKRTFLAGKRGWLDLLNALREAIQAEQLFGEMQVQAAVAAYRLRVYAGELPWQAAGGEAPDR